MFAYAIGCSKSRASNFYLGTHLRHIWLRIWLFRGFLVSFRLLEPNNINARLSGFFVTQIEEVFSFSQKRQYLHLLKTKKVTFTEAM